MKRLRDAAEAVVREWDKYGAATNGAKDELRAALTAPLCGNCGGEKEPGRAHAWEGMGMCSIYETRPV